MSASQLVDLLGTPHAMYAVVDSSASDSVYSSVVSLGASLAEVPVASVGTCVDTSPGAAPEDASLSFTLDSGASHCFFRDRTKLTSLPMSVSVALADPNSGPVTARYTTTLPCLANPSGSLTGFRVPSFSRNLVGVRPLVSQHVGVWIEPFGKTAVCVDGDTAAAAAAAAAASTAPDFCHCPPLGSRVSPGCRVSLGSCVWSGLLHVLPSLPPSLAPPCSPCVEGWLRTTPQSSSLRPATEPFKTLHLDVWGPASRPGPERESFFLVVVDDYSRYTTVFPLAKKSDGIRQSWTLPESPQQNGVAERRIGLVMEIARASMTHARAPHFLWPYAVRYAAHQLNLWPRVSRPKVSPTSLWTGSPGAALRFCVWGCLALVRDTSADKISPRAVPCVFLGFPGDSSNYTFYHPPLHRFFDSCDVCFDESVPYYVRYLCQGLPVPPAPLVLTLAPPLAPPVQPPPPRPAPSAYSRPCGSRFSWRESVPVQGPESGGAEPVTAGDSSLRGAGVSGAVPGSAMTGGAPSAGPREPGTDPVTSSGAGSGGGATGSLESGPGATTALDTTPPPHPYPTRHQARVRHASAGGGGAAAAAAAGGGATAAAPAAATTTTSSSCLWPSDPRSPLSFSSLPPSPPISGLSLPPPDPSPALFPPPLPPLSPPLSHTWSSRRSPHARPSSPVPFTNLHTALFRSSPPRLSPSVLPSPPESALTAPLSTPDTYYYCTYRPVLSCALASLVTDPHASLSSVSALTAAVTEFASTRCLYYATSLVAAPPTSPLAVGGESALGCDALEDRQFELEFLAAASPHLYAMLLAPEGDPDALDIPTPRTYAEVVSGPWASQWRAAMDSEMASYRSKGTYIDEVPPFGANVVDGMWIFKVKRPPGSPPVLKARYVARGFSQREVVDFFQTFAPTPKMTTLRV
ncbi:unnamed protein product [Closterium sp. NIES-53]